MVPNARKKSVVSDLVLPTAGEYFSDGRILELVSDNSIPGKLALLLWDGKRALVAGRFKVGDRIYVPVSLDSSTLEAIRFPVNAIGYGSVTGLFEKIVDVVNKSSGSQPGNYTPSPTSFWPHGFLKSCPRHPRSSSQDRRLQRRGAFSDFCGASAGMALSWLS